MKIILSRKGFDSANGGYPSPILKDGKMVSLPIPSVDSVKYSDLKLSDGQTYFNLMNQLKPRILFRKKRLLLANNQNCHLDPDIYPKIIEREDQEHWKPCFGQINQAQSHLHKEGVKTNDLFLFFGWFRNTIKDGSLHFDKYAPDLHVIFGYFQIGVILPVNDKTKIPDWLKYHPHASDEYRNKPNNTIYIARKYLSWDKSPLFLKG